jgi:hypothetical protein
MSDVTGELEKFIQRYYDLEVIVSQEAHKLITVSKKTLADLLGNSIVAYIESRNGDEQTKKQLAKTCFAVMTKAYADGFILPGQDLLRKLDECRTKNAELEKDLAKCLTNYSVLQREHERLLRMLDQNQSPAIQSSEKNE